MLICHSVIKFAILKFFTLGFIESSDARILAFPDAEQMDKCPCRENAYGFRCEKISEPLSGILGRSAENTDDCHYTEGEEDCYADY